MKIVFCIDGLKNFGGMERVVVNRANYLVKKYGYDISIITTENFNKENKNKPLAFTLNPKINLIDLEINFNDSIEKNIFFKIFIKIKRKLLYKIKLEKVINELKPDIIDSMGDRSREVLYKLKIKSKKILENHFNKNSIIRDTSNDKLLKKMYFNIKNYKQLNLVKKYDEFIVLTEEDRMQWNDSKIKVIPNSLSYYPKEISNLKEKKVISIGRLDYYKGFDLMIQIWRKVVDKHPEWKLEIYGEGSIRNSLQEEIKKWKLEKNIELKGNCINIQEKLLTSSMFIMTSRGEGMPMVLLEAASCGLPLISFDRPCGPKDLIKNGENGFLCKFGELDEMANRIIFLIENEKIRKEIGIKARKLSLEYSEDKIMSIWKELYESNKSSYTSSWAGD